MSKCLAIKTGETTLEPTAQSNAVATAMKLAVLQKQANQSFAPNDEIWITESGNFTVPYDGVYEILLIDGGQGGWAFTEDTQRYVLSGWSGSYGTRLEYYQKGQEVSVTIGSGGTGYIGNPDNLSVRNGGITSFDGKFTPAYNSFTGSTQRIYDDDNMILSCAGAGFGGGGITTPHVNAQFYGAGGGALNFDGEIFVGNGGAGAVRLRFFNPDKATLPAINDTDLIPYVNLIKRIEALENSRGYNTEEWITESGTWTAPVDGYYEISIINGGNAARQDVVNYIYSGEGQAPKTVISKLTKGQVIPVTVGAGGIGGSTSANTFAGGATTFGDISANTINYVLQGASNTYYNSTGVLLLCFAYGGGVGGGHADDVGNYANGSNYGAGGGGYHNQSGNRNKVGNGYQGAVRLRYYDPSKDNNN